MESLLSYVNTSAILTICGCALTLVFKAGALSTKVDLIMSNHLPHLETAIRELREAFTQHLDKGAKE